MSRLRALLIMTGLLFKIEKLQLVASIASKIILKAIEAGYMHRYRAPSYICYMHRYRAPSYICYMHLPCAQGLANNYTLHVPGDYII